MDEERTDRLHYLRLAYRGPRRLANLLFLSFLLFPLVAPLADAGLEALRFAPAAGVLACTLLAGATFCLNPLGDERGTLSLALLSGTDAEAFVRGRIVAGLVPGSAALVLAGAVGTAAGVPPSSVGWLVALGLALSVPAGAVAAGLGVLVPRYEAEEVFGVETVRPSNVPLFAFQFGALVVGAAGLLIVGAPDPSFGTIRSRWPFILAYAAVVAASGTLCYLTAVRRLRAKTIER